MEQLAADVDFTQELRRGLSQRDRYLHEPGWHSSEPNTRSLNCIAYFSMEFGLAEALPIYSGGLGILIAPSHPEAWVPIEEPLILWHVEPTQGGVGEHKSYFR